MTNNLYHAPLVKNFSGKNRKGSAFSLIELIVVIAVIALVLGLGTIYFENVFQKGRDTKRVSDINQIKNALELYYRGEGKYPDAITFGEALIGEKTGINYMVKLPTNPKPRNDGSCLDGEYTYTTSSDIFGKAGVVLGFCLGNKINNIEKGINCLDEKGITSATSTCPTANLQSGLSLWLKADGEITVRSSGSNNFVTNWKDLSVNKNNAVQITEASQPKLISNILNNKPIVRFDGTDDYMIFNEINNIRSAFFVLNHATGSGNYQPLLGHSSLYDWHGGLDTYIFDCSNSYKVTNGQAYTNGTLTACSGLIKSTTHKIFSFITSENAGAKYITNDRDIGRVWSGDYAEIILYNRALTITERQNVEKYLSQKYNISLSY